MQPHEPPACISPGELREALRSAEDLHLTDAELDDLFDDLGVKDSGGLHTVPARAGCHRPSRPRTPSNPSHHSKTPRDLPK